MKRVCPSWISLKDKLGQNFAINLFEKKTTFLVRNKCVFNCPFASQNWGFYGQTYAQNALHC